jgi:hypothetical protein
MRDVSVHVNPLPSKTPKGRVKANADDIVYCIIHGFPLFDNYVFIRPDLKNRHFHRHLSPAVRMLIPPKPSESPRTEQQIKPVPVFFGPRRKPVQAIGAHGPGPETGLFFCFLAICS